MQAGQVDLVLNLKGQPAAVQGVSQFQQAVSNMGTRTAAALGQSNQAATALGTTMTHVGAAASSMASQASKIDAAFSSVAAQSQGLASRLQELSSGWRAAGISESAMEGRLLLLRHELEHLGLPAKELDAQFKALSLTMNQTGQAGNTFAEVMKGTFTGQAAYDAARRLGTAFIGLGESSISAALQLQRIGRGLEYANGSAAAGAEAFAFVRAESERLGLSLPKAASEFAKMSAAARGTSLEGKGVRDIFSGISEAATVLGLSADDTSGALNAIQQMMSKGSVQAEELRGQLGERLYGAFNLASEAMGVSTAQLGKMLQNGEVMASDLLPRFAVELHKSFGVAAVQAAGQGQGAINRFETAMFDLQATLGGELLPPLIEVITAIKDMVTKAQAAGDIKIIFAGIGEAARIAAGGVSILLPVVAKFAEANIGMIHGAQVLFDTLFGIDGAAEKAAQGVNKLAAAQKATGNGITITDDPKMTQEKIDQVNKIYADATKARLESSLQGFALQRALEDNAYSTNLAKLQGNNAAVQAEQSRHIAAMHLLKVQESQSDYALLQDSANHREEFALKAREKQIQEEIIRRRVAADNAAADEEYFKGKTKFQEQLEAETFVGSQRELSISHAKYESLRNEAREWLLDEGELQAALSAIDATEGKKRNQIAFAEFQQRSEFAASMVTNLIQGLDAFYGHSKKNAVLHKTLAIAMIEIDGALAAMKAFESAQDLPYPYNLIAGGVAAAAVEFKTQGFANKASQQHFANSGIVAGDSRYGDNVPVWANSGEMFLNGTDQKSLFNLIKSGAGGAGPLASQGKDLSITFAPVVHAAPGTDVRSVTEALSRERVEFGRLLDNELRRKRYIH